MMLTNKRVKAVAIAFAAYAVTHLLLSRVSLHLVRQDWGVQDAFLYLPVRPGIVADNECPLLYVHLALRFIFLPAWQLDHAVFGGPIPFGSLPMRGISS